MQYQAKYPYATTAQHYGAEPHSRKEQRRRQQEYSQALAQQVEQCAQQKQRERERDHFPYMRNPNGYHNPLPSRQDAFESAERGFFDGLGQNNPQNSRVSFARGQQQLHHRHPGRPDLMSYPEGNAFLPRQASYVEQTLRPANLASTHHQSSVDQQSLQEGVGFSGSTNLMQPQALNGVGMPSFASGANMQHGWAPQNAQKVSIAQTQSSQMWPGQGINEQAAQPTYDNYPSPHRRAQQLAQPGYSQVEAPGNYGGRRRRADIHDDSQSESEEVKKFRLKHQQQQEMQFALERQIEEKKQRKLEEKRRQEEEDRREMMRFEEEQRRLRAEQERLEEEKRRKAELEQKKADQAAAAVAAANQQAKLQQQKKLHAQISQAQPQYSQHPHHAPDYDQRHLQPPVQSQSEQSEDVIETPSPDRLKNPFNNSRAHLFEDPPPQRVPLVPSNQFGHFSQNALPIQEEHQDFSQAVQHENNALGQSINPSELRRQYDDMREELRIQKQLVDQLRQAQAQMQQQPKQVESENAPTLMDLEKLRNELRGEIAHREQIHQQELASLKREQYQGRSSVQCEATIPSELSAYEFKQRQSVVPVHAKQSSIDHLFSVNKAPADECLMSLGGESKFVFFDRRVMGVDKTVQSGVVQDVQDPAEQAEGVLDEHSELIKVDELRPTQQTFQPLTRLRSTQPWNASKSAVTKDSVCFARKSGVTETDSDDEDLNFVVVEIPSLNQSQELMSSRSHKSTASSHRYSRLPPAMASPSSPSKQTDKWRFAATSINNTSDSDEELDASLDGEKLQALFQRNLRRHEILFGFQSKHQAQPQISNQRDDCGIPIADSAGAKVHRQLESNGLVTQQRRMSMTSMSSNDEGTALAASSRWMPSLPFRNTENDNPAH